MATLGRREMISSYSLEASGALTLEANTPAENIAASQIQLAPVSTLDVTPSLPGSPIMREDFITRTGFMPSKSE
jgi:hypothetical protein